MNYQRPELLDRLAADYVLGVLRLRARARFEALCVSIPAAGAAKRRWEDRLLPWALACRAVTPGATVWPQISKRVATATSGGSQRVSRRFSWRVALAASLVGVALLVGRLTIWRPPSWQPLAVLAPSPAAPLWRIEQSADASRIHIRTVGIVTLASTQSYELWILPKRGGNAVSLGLLPRSGELARVLTPQQRLQLLGAANLAVSIEPLTGSPTGQPTGPVVVVAAIQRAG
jgi:anti-sigma-K factor RskA